MEYATMGQDRTQDNRWRVFEKAEVTSLATRPIGYRHGHRFWRRSDSLNIQHFEHADPDGQVSANVSALMSILYVLSSLYGP